MEWISQREAAARFAARGLSRSATQHLLATGIAGKPQRLRSVTLYDAARVEEVVGRSHVRADEFEASFPCGVVVARLPRSRVFDATTEWSETAEALAGPWAVRPWQALLIGLSADGAGIPLVLSVSGYLLAGALITGFGASTPEGVRCTLAAPSAAITPLLGRRMRGRRGAPVEVVGWRTDPGRPRFG